MNVRPIALAAAALALLAVAPPAARAAGTTVTNPDRNLLIRVQDALANGEGTRLLYFTTPDITQAHAGERCAVNVYVLALRPGLADATPRLLAGDFCGHFGMKGVLLEGGGVVLIAGDRVETWRLGKGQTRAWRLSDVPSLRGRWKEVNDGTVPLDVSRDGGVVLARPLPRKRNDTTTPSTIVAGLSADGAPRWRLELAEPGVLLGVMGVWATADGGALLHVVARPLSGAGLPGAKAPAGAIVTDETRLYRVSAKGALSAPVVIARHQMPDVTAPPPPMPDPAKDPAAFQATLQGRLALSTGTTYTGGQVAAHPKADGAVDVLIGRGAGEARLVRIGRDGRVRRDTSLDDVLAEEGLRDWTDFAADADRVVLYGTLGTRENRLPQGYFSRIALPDGGAVTRLVPLDPRGLSAARTAADAEVRYLEDNPSQQPRLLTRLGGGPLAVSLVTRAHRPAIQLDEGTDRLAVYTEAKDARRADAEAAARREGRDADREARHAQLNADLAAAAGVSPEAAAEPPPAPSAAEMNARMAAALAQAREAMAARGIQVPGLPGAPGADVLKLDADRRARIEYRLTDGGAVTLLVRDRGTGKELLRKTYADGTIRETVEFGRFGLPLERIDVSYRDAADRTVGHPALVAASP